MLPSPTVYILATDSVSQIPPGVVFPYIFAITLRRKSLSGNWKTNVGQSILEEVPVQEKYKGWIDQVGGAQDLFTKLFWILREPTGVFFWSGRLQC